MFLWNRCQVDGSHLRLSCMSWACLHSPHCCNTRLGHSHAFEPTNVCLGWFAPNAAAPGSPLYPSASGHFQPSEALCWFSLCTHTLIKLNKLWELYS